MKDCPDCRRRERRNSRLDRLLLGLYASQAIGWTLALPFILLSALAGSVEFVNAISVWALVLAGASGWAGMLAARRAATT